MNQLLHGEMFCMIDMSHMVRRQCEWRPYWYGVLALAIPITLNWVTSIVIGLTLLLSSIKKFPAQYWLIVGSVRLSLALLLLSFVDL
jgi:hypothetical protein